MTRFRTFARDFAVIHPDDPFVVGDIRYAMLPDSIRPLWGIRLNPETPAQHAQYVTFRRLDEPTFSHFLAMLTGEENAL